MGNQVIGVVGKGEPQGDWWTGVKEIVYEHHHIIKLGAVSTVAGGIFLYITLPVTVSIVSGVWSVGKFLVTNPLITKAFVPVMTGVVTKNVADNYLGVNKEDHAHKKLDQHLESVINVAVWEATNKHSPNKQLNKQGDIHHTAARLEKEISDFFTMDNLLSMVTPSNMLGVIASTLTLVIPGASQVAIASTAALGAYKSYDHYYDENSSELEVVGDAASHD